MDIVVINDVWSSDIYGNDNNSNDDDVRDVDRNDDAWLPRPVPPDFSEVKDFRPEADDERVPRQEDRVVGAHQAGRHLVAHVLKKRNIFYLLYIGMTV